MNAVSRWGVKRRGRDSNPEVLADAGFRDRCIAVLPPLRGVLLYSDRITRREAVSVARSGPLWIRLGKYGRGGIRTHVTLVMSTHFPGVRLQPLGHPSRISGGAGIRTLVGLLDPTP